MQGRFCCGCSSCCCVSLSALACARQVSGARDIHRGVPVPQVIHLVVAAFKVENEGLSQFCGLRTGAGLVRGREGSCPQRDDPTTTPTPPPYPEDEDELLVELDALRGRPGASVGRFVCRGLVISSSECECGTTHTVVGLRPRGARLLCRHLRSLQGLWNKPVLGTFQDALVVSSTLLLSGSAMPAAATCANFQTYQQQSVVTEEARMQNSLWTPPSGLDDVGSSRTVSVSLHCATPALKQLGAIAVVN